MSKQAWIAAALCAVLSTGVRAEEDVTKHPGYVDFGLLNVFGKADTNVEIFLDQNILKMVDAFAGGDPELAGLTAKLKQIRVQSFAIDPSKIAELEGKTSDLSKKLEAQGWSTLVKVRDRKKDSHTYVYMKWKDGKSQGLAVMNVEPNEDATFVNIVGEIDPEKISALTRKVHIDHLDSLNLDLRGLDDSRDRKK